MSDVVSRLLAAIDERQRHAEATKSVGMLWEWGARRNGKATVRAFLTDNDPGSVLRLCQAHRDIVALHQPIGGYTPPDDWYGNRNECQTCGGYERVALLGDRGHRSPWPCQTLIILARGYGVEDGETK